MTAREREILLQIQRQSAPVGPSPANDAAACGVFDAYVKELHALEARGWIRLTTMMNRMSRCGTWFAAGATLTPKGRAELESGVKGDCRGP
jgi:hypothetical protein